MPRKARELMDGGIYQCFLSHLGEGLKAIAIELYHYCLMPNHFHLLLKIQRGEDLSNFMHRLQLAYIRYFKKTRAFSGHVFQERFRSPRIHEESYYLQCGRYIERNPVKAGLVEDAADYLYSSGRFYALGSPDSLVTRNPYFVQMGASEPERRQRYRQFLMFDEPYRGMLDEALLRG